MPKLSVSFQIKDHTELSSSKSDDLDTGVELNAFEEDMSARSDESKILEDGKVKALLGLETSENFLDLPGMVVNCTVCIT